MKKKRKEQDIEPGVVIATAIVGVWTAQNNLQKN